MDDHTMAGRVFEILDAVGACASMGLAEIVAVTGIPKSSVHRIADDLAARGALLRTADGYRLGPRVRRLADVAPRRERFDGIESTLGELHERLGGIAWYSERGDRLVRQPTLLVANPHLRMVAVTGWPDPASLHSLLSTAHGQAVLAARPDLVERLPPTVHGRRLRDLLSSGVDRGAFFDDHTATTGWRCVAVRLAGGDGGIVGVTVPGDRVKSPELIRTTRLLAEHLENGAGASR